MFKFMIAGSALLGTAAAAQQAASPPEDRGPANDPTQVICRVQKEIGSRLRAQRICRTRAEWETVRRDVRDDVERAQQNTASSGN